MIYPARTNQQWIDELTGQRGEVVQADAFKELSKYLYIIACNFLSRVQNSTPQLYGLHAVEIEPYAEDFVQDTLLKLTSEDFKRLKQFRGEGSFTSWIAQIMSNLVRDNLRSAAWRKCCYLGHEAEAIPDLAISTNPDKQIIGSHLWDKINTYLDELSPNCRSVFIRCVVEEESKLQVAEELGLTMNALYIQISRSRQYIRDNLTKDGLIPDLWCN